MDNEKCDGKRFSFVSQEAEGAPGEKPEVNNRVHMSSCPLWETAGTLASRPGTTSACPSEEGRVPHVQVEPGTTSDDSSRIRGGDAPSMVEARDPAAHPGVEGRGARGLQPRHVDEHQPTDDPRPSTGKQEEDHAGQLLPGGAPHEPEWKRDRSPAGDQGCESHHGTVSGGGQRPGGIRQVHGQEVLRGRHRGPGLCGMGQADGTGKPRVGMRSPAVSFCRVAGRTCSCPQYRGDAIDGYADNQSAPEGSDQEATVQDGSHREGLRHTLSKLDSHDGAAHGRDVSHHRAAQERAGRSQGRTTPEDDDEARGREWNGDGRLLPEDPLGHEVDRSERDKTAPDTELFGSCSKRLSRELSKPQARTLEEQGRSVVPNLFQALVGHDRPVLMEIACSPESVLTASVQKQAGRETAAVRCSWWNGCDLNTAQGLKNVLNRIREERPQHVWLSPPCGPYSPLQNTNQRTPEQCEELKRKRREALRIYLSAACIVHLCVQVGSHVTWELAERSQAWRLPVLYNLQNKLGMHVAVTKGCRVGLRPPKGGHLMQKGWRLMTTCQRLAQSMNMPCVCSKDFVHGKCEGSSAEGSAYYTPEFGRRVARVMCQELDHHQTIQECKGHSKLPERFGLGEACVCSELQVPNQPQTCAMCIQGGSGPEAPQEQGVTQVAPQQVSQEGRGEGSCEASCWGYQGVERDVRSTNPDQGSSTGMPPEMACVIKDRRPWQGPLKQQDTSKLHESIKRKLYLLHAATGHSSVRHMIEALKRRGAPSLVIDLARKFTCSICQERKHVPPRQVASLEPLPQPFHTLTADIGHWTHSRTGEQQNFMLLIDEGTRFRAAKILTKGYKKTPNAALCVQYLSEGWIQMFGKPKTLRLDPAGSFRSQQIEGFCDRHSIFLDVIPGEAHWQIGTAEQAIQGVKQLLDKLQAIEPDETPENLLSLAISTFNQRDLVRGFSPSQHVLGRNTDATGRYLGQGQEAEEDVILNDQPEAIVRASRLRAEAEKALIDWQAQQRVSRALNSRTRPYYAYQPGDLVYFWRTQEAGRHRRHPGMRQGRFLGPARVLSMEVRADPQGGSRPASAIWCVRGRSLLKCSPEQLRPASDREELLEALSEDSGTPWTFTKLADQIGRNQYEDISQELPDAAEWHRAQDSRQELQPVRQRITSKRAAPAPAGEDEMSERDETAGGSMPSRPNRPQAHVGITPEDGATWQEAVPESAWSAEASCYWADSLAAVEVEIAVPESRRGCEAMVTDLQGFFVGALKRKAAEVSEKRLTEEERQQFREAKAIEVRNFVASQAFEALPEHIRPSRDQAINMRWILTWKIKDDGTTKPKARAVLLGYQDPSYEHRATTSPVMTRQTRQLQLQLTANRRWRLQKGDITGAFLQGRSYPDDLFCVPCPEICQAMNLPEGSITRLKKAAYGLVDAPLEWYKTMAEFLESIGFERMWSDACAWLWRPDGELRGMISGHVDDFIFSGDDVDKGWAEQLRKIREKFKWGDWDQDRFVQCGVQIETIPEGFALSQPRYMEGLKDIHVNASRRKERKSPTTEVEKTKLRALLGGLSWHAQQVAPHLSAEVGLLLSEVTGSTVETLCQANALLQHARSRKDHRMIISRCQDSDMQFYAWVDAASQNRVDGSSTQGVLVGAASGRLLKGDVCHVSPISWHSQKIDRACRSPGAAETLAASSGEDCLYYIRFQWSEMLYGRPDIRDADATVSRTGGCLITDSRNVYDKLRNEVVSIKGAEKRANIELLGLKQSQMSTQLVVRWVHSEAQLANGLTKARSAKEIDRFYAMGHSWRIIEDEDMKSARRRKSEGIQPLEQTDKHFQSESGREQRATSEKQSVVGF